LSWVLFWILRPYYWWRCWDGTQIAVDFAPAGKRPPGPRSLKEIKRPDGTILWSSYESLPPWTREEMPPGELICLIDGKEIARLSERDL
jgi:hypothetical protein